MSVKLFATPEVQKFLSTVANLEGPEGNPRVKQAVHRIVSDLFKTIEDLDLTPDEVWAGINYLNTLGARGEAALLTPGLGIEHYLDLRLDAADKAAGISGGTPRTIEGPLYVAGAPVREGKTRIDKDADADAGPVRIHGTVTGPDGQPVAGAVVEIWHANSKGFYSHFDPTGAQSPLNLRGAVKTGADGRYEFRSLMPVGYGCPPDGPTQALLNQLGRHGQRPAHVHYFVSAPGLRKLTTQFNVDGDPLMWDDFAFATREGLIPPVVAKNDGRTQGFDADAYQDIQFDVRLTPQVAGTDNQIVDRPRVAA